METEQEKNKDNSGTKIAAMEEAKTGGHLFIKYLQKTGAQFVFGTTGAGLADVQDAMVVVKPPKFIQGLHEFTSVSAACGYALASGEAGLALIDRIVGTQNAVGALYGAYQNFAPVVVFASRDVPGIRMEPDAAHYHSDMLQMVKPWVKWTGEIQSLEGLSQTIGKALFAARSEPRGPAFVTLRRDLMSQQLPPQNNFAVDTPVTYLSATVPEDSVLKAIADEIVSHSNPKILVSHAGRNPASVEALVRLAHLCGVGVIERRYFMNYPSLDSLHQSFLYVRRPRLVDLLSDSDLVVLLEAGLSGHNKIPENIDAIDLSSDPMHRQDLPLGGDDGSYVFPTKIRVACEVGPTLAKLARIVEDRLDEETRAAITERITKSEERHSKLQKERREKARRGFESGVLDGWSMGYVMNKHLSAGAVWVNGTPSLTYTETIEAVELEKPGTYFSNPSTHVGVTVGMGYGVAMGDRRYVATQKDGGYSSGHLSPVSKVVVCTVGDGEAIFGNIDSALWTAKHYSVGLVYVIFNNSCWGVDAAFIDRSSQHWAKASADYEFVDIDRPSIDFKKLGESFSVRSASASDPESFDAELEKAIGVARGGEPALVELKLEKYTGGKASSVL